MIITKELTIIVEEKTASLDEKLYFYQGDKGIKIYFTVADSKFIFSEYDDANMLTGSSAKYSIIRVLKPRTDEDGSIKHTVKRTPIEDNRVLLEIDDDFANDVTEIGVYQLQISLYDDGYGRVTIPPVTFEVLKPIYDFTEEELEEYERIDSEGE